jgi:hypothetical protein
MSAVVGRFPQARRFRMSDRYPDYGFVLFLFAIFCAYWAQTTRRNPWTWFFLGLFFGPITGLVLLSKNKDELAKAAAD